VRFIQEELPKEDSCFR